MKSAALPCFSLRWVNFSPAILADLVCFPNLANTSNKANPRGPMKPCKFVGQISEKTSPFLCQPAIARPAKATKITMKVAQTNRLPIFSCRAKTSFLFSPLSKVLFLRQEYCHQIQKSNPQASTG